MSNVVVIYHDQCMDGMASAYLMSKHFPGAKFYPASYGDTSAPPFDSGDFVYIVDFSFPPDVLREWAKVAFSVSVIDHHASFERDLVAAGFSSDESPLGFTRFYDPEVLGLTIFFYRTCAGVGGVANFLGKDITELPRVLGAIDERDRWDFSNEDTKALTETAKLFKKDLPTFTQFVEVFSTADHLVAGKVLLLRSQQVCAELSNGAHTINLGGNEALAVNASHLHASELCDLMMCSATDEGFFDVSVSYRYNSNREVTMSLRSTRRGPDVGAVAKLFGGGGHRNSAGCKVSKEVFEEMCKGSRPVKWAENG